MASFDGLGTGFLGPQNYTPTRNPSDNSLAVGPDHIVQIVNSRMAIFTKKGRAVRHDGEGAPGSRGHEQHLQGFGGLCEARNNGDAVVRYDQLADRWLFVMPIFSRGKASTRGPSADSPATQTADSSYAMCYAVSIGADPLGPYYRYEFVRPLFPDYPRPAVWPDGYYVPTSTGDDVIQKHACVVDRTRMLSGEPATEQCVIIDGVNFLNNADLDGTQLPPAGAPNIMMAAGGTQLKQVMEDDGIYVWKFHVDWGDPSKTSVDGPVKISVAPYHYLCDGQLTNCVPQPGTDRRLDAQGDKIMARLVYRRIGNREIDRRGALGQHQRPAAVACAGTSSAWTRRGTSRCTSRARSHQAGRTGGWGVRRSTGRETSASATRSAASPDFAGQRFAGRGAGDPLGVLTLHEIHPRGGRSGPGNTLRWEDYTQTAIDPIDDCTVWYVGDYVKKDAATYSTRIGAFRMPGCR